MSPTKFTPKRKQDLQEMGHDKSSPINLDSSDDEGQEQKKPVTGLKDRLNYGSNKNMNSKSSQTRTIKDNQSSAGDMDYKTYTITRNRQGDPFPSELSLQAIQGDIAIYVKKSSSEMGTEVEKITEDKYWEDQEGPEEA